MMLSNSKLAGFQRVLWIIILTLVAPGALRGAVIAAEEAAPRDRVVLENASLRVEFSTADGRLTRLRNKPAGLELIQSPERQTRPWALLLAPLRLVSDFAECRVIADSETPHREVSISWNTPQGITVVAKAKLEPESDELHLTCAARNDGDETIIALRYPDIQGIGTLSETGESDRLLHSASMGLVFNDPFHLFLNEHPIAPGRGLVACRYPNGFGGAAMQLMAYYIEGQGGFSLECRDGGLTDKELNFFKESGDSLSCQFTHFNAEARPGRNLSLEYPVVIAAMTKGTWYEAAARYREWAQNQLWCERGTLEQRVADNAASRWLVEDIGAAGTWWPFRQDIRPAIERTRTLFGAPLLHLELWWRHAASVQSAHDGGDRFGPFYFPHLALRGTETFEKHPDAEVAPPAFSISPKWAVMCAAEPGWRTVFEESAEDLVGHGPLRHSQIWVDENQVGCDADCLYFDIGPCAGIPTHCYAEQHGHAPGAGQAITAAHISLMEESRRRASALKGTYVPIGTECVSEPFIGALDFFYARNAGFNLEMELSTYARQLTWLPDGKMEAVPLFSFVYHEYGPLAIQGLYSVNPWGRSAADDFYSWAEARSYLWGGIVTVFPVSKDADVSPSRRAFLRSLAAARTGFARDYLAYGRMQPPPAFSCEMLDLDHGLGEGGWLRKLRFADTKTAAESIRVDVEAPGGDDSSDSGAAGNLSVEEWIGDVLAVGAPPAGKTFLRVPAVLCQAYTHGDDRLGLLFVNLKSDAEQIVRVPLDPAAFGLKSGPYRLIRRDQRSETELGTTNVVRELEIRVPPRELLLVEAVAEDAAVPQP